MMRVIDEMLNHGYNIVDKIPRVHCKVFEDNSGALAIAKEFKYRPRTKHLCVKLHHFRHHVDEGRISIHKIDTTEQPADYLTKPLAEDLLFKHRKKVQGW